MQSRSLQSALFCALLTFSLSSHADRQWPSKIEINPMATEMALTIINNPDGCSKHIDNVITSVGIHINESPATTPISVGQQISIERWQVELLKLAQQQGVKIELDQYLLSWQLAGDGANGPLPTQATLDPLFRQKFIEALRTVAENTDYDESGLSLMVGVIVALGREDLDEPYDILDLNVSGKVQLNSLQTAFLTQRIAAELYAQALVVKSKTAPANNILAKPFDTKLLATTKLACTMTDVEGMLMDSVAASSGALLGGVQFAGGILERLKDMKFISETGLEKYNKMATIANVAANYIKLLWTMAAFRSKMESNPNPLERTKNQTAGKGAELTAKFWLDIGNAQMVNCIRPALNAVGLDFSLPQDGPLTGTRVEWDIKTKVGSEVDVIETVGSDPLRQVTDENGISKIKIQGKAQKKDLTKAKKLVRIDRRVPVVAITNLKPNNAKQDLIDVSAGLGGITALWSLPVELLNRLPFLFRARTVVKVIDWKEAEGDLFLIEGLYQEKDQSSISSSIKNYSDRVAFGVEIKIVPRGTSSGMLTSMIDSDAKYDLKYETNISTGEGCKGTQTAVGKKDTFTYTPTANVTVFYNPASDEAKISVSLKGLSQNLGWQYTSDYAQCKWQDVKSETSEANGIYIAFSSLDFQNGKKEHIIDNRDQDGFGWVFKITPVP